MQKINYQKQLDKIIENIKSDETPTLLIHSCCAPCSSYVLEYLSQYFKITIFYYNPNIYPKEEYLKRVEEQKRLLSQLPAKNPVDFIEGRFDESEFYNAVKGLEHIPEGGERCFACYRLRLEETARLAKEQKLAIMMGTEGDGLADTTIDNCDYTVKIPMAHGVDSLNVAAAGAVAFWTLCRKRAGE